MILQSLLNLETQRTRQHQMILKKIIQRKMIPRKTILKKMTQGRMFRTRKILKKTPKIRFWTVARKYGFAKLNDVSVLEEIPTDNNSE